MFLTPIYMAMTFVRTWRMRSFRARLLEFLGGDTSVAFCRVPENAAETPTLSSKLCTNPKNAHLCDLLDYTTTTRVCSMKPQQSIELRDWVSSAGGLPLGSGDSLTDILDLDILLECEMTPADVGFSSHLNLLESFGSAVAWKAGSHLALVVRTNMEHLAMIGFNFVGGEFLVDHKLPVVRIQTVLLTGEPNKAIDPSMRSLRSDIQHSLKKPTSQFQWSVHAALLRKLSKVVDIKTESGNTLEMNGNTNNLQRTSISKSNMSLTDVSVNTVHTASSDIGTATENGIIKEIEDKPVTSESKPEVLVSNQNFTVEIQHNITPKKTSLKLDLKKGTAQLSSSLLNITSQIKSVTTHKRLVSTTGPKKSLPDSEKRSKTMEESQKNVEVDKTPTKTTRASRPLVNTKAVNVLIYSDSVVTRDNLETTLKQILDTDRYTIYAVNADTLESGAWRGRAALVAVAGDVPSRAAALLLAHLLSGGRLLALCSDLLHTTLPYYKTAEVRENEVVQFSYDKWQSVRMKHHIFCYQASPAKKQFSTESDKQTGQELFRPSKYTGHPGHELDIQILASEETWKTPSLLQATDRDTGGIAVFSQIHLEAVPSEYLGAEGAPLDTVRLEMLRKVLGELLGLHTRSAPAPPLYTRGYFLGEHVRKMAVVEALCPAGEGGGARVSRSSAVTMQWCARGEPPQRAPAADFLPVMVHECPEYFSTVDYFDNLTSECLGRLVVYSDALASTHELVAAARGAHGLAVVARELSAARGRGGNRWIGARGCAMISLQVWLKTSCVTPLAQHAAALAAVRCVRTLPGHEQLDIRIKWPNDIYYGRESKIGGILTTATCIEDDVIVNIGIGVNLSNEHPTTCINEIIRRHNATSKGTVLPPLSLEKFLARYCSQLERILAYMQTDGGVDAFLEQYYAYWLHDGEEVQVLQSGAAAPVAGTVLGLDGAGFLRVRTPRADLVVHPGDNTFDMMSGLIAPRH